MEVLKFSKLLIGDRLEKVALIYCSLEGTIKQVSFKTLVDWAYKVEQFILEVLQKLYPHTKIPGSNNGKGACFGLLMSKSFLVLSILICFQELKCCYAFVTPKTLKRIEKLLSLQWIISTDTSENMALLNKQYTKEGTLEISADESLILWKNRCELDWNCDFYKDIFCVQFTSGSTGKCKAVGIPVNCIENNILSLNKHFKITSKDVIYWGTPLTFDPTLVELLLGLSCGATLVIVPTATQLNPTLLYEALFKVMSVTFLQMVPSIFIRWTKEQISQILLNSSLRTLALGGERFPQEILSYERSPALKLFNLYGVTELSCWATIEDLSTHDSVSEVPLGECLDETFIQIEHFVHKNDSNMGEICVGSNTRYCLLNSEDADRTTLPFKVQTGDLGEVKNGKIYFRGRKTRLVKRLGHKILLPKLEEQIFFEIGLPSRLVYLENHKKLLAFILVEEQFDKPKKLRVIDKLRLKLLQFLPDHSCPDYFDILTHFPVNQHGKVCDKLLERMYNQSLLKEDCDNSPAEKVFRDYLGLYLRTDLSGQDFQQYTFFELGGNSILAIQLLTAFENRIHKEVPKEFFTLLINDKIEACLNYARHKLGVKRKKYQENTENGNSSKKDVKLNYEDHLNCVRWKYNLKGCVDSSPLVFQNSDKIFVACGSFAHIFAIVSESGNNYTTFSFPQEIESKPAISEDGSTIFIGCNNGYLYAIDINHKQIIWEHQTPQPVKCHALISEGNLIFGSYDGTLFSLSQQDGGLNWQKKLSGSIKADPILCDNLKCVYVGTTRGICYYINNENGNIIWQNNIEGPIFGSPCVIEGNSIWPCVTGLIYCIFSTGKIAWTIQVDGHIFSSLVAQDKKIFFTCHDRYLYKLASNQSISKYFMLESESSSSPFLYNFGGKLFVVCASNSGTLSVIEESSRTSIFNIQLPSQSFSSPFVFNNNVYIGCRDNNLYCINIDVSLKKCL